MHVCCVLLYNTFIYVLIFINEFYNLNELTRKVHDAGQPTLTSCDVEHQAIFTLPPKVDSFWAYNPIGLHVNGMLFDPNAPWDRKSVV